MTNSPGAVPVLRGQNGSTFGITIAAYKNEFLEIDPYHSNYLDLHVSISSPGEHWDGRMWGILAWEVEPLVEWLKAHGRGDSAKSEFGFMEPDLTFRVAPVDGELIDFTVILHLMGIPAWLREKDGELWEGEWTLRVKRQELTRAAWGIYSEFGRFEKRPGLPA